MTDPMPGEKKTFRLLYTTAPNESQRPQADLQIKEIEQGVELTTKPRAPACAVSRV